MEFKISVMYDIAKVLALPHPPVISEIIFTLTYLFNVNYILLSS